MHGRLFEMLYLLIERGNIPARELAERFEVSVRTIYRDVDTLSAAGIPVYAERGRGGGIRLTEGFVLDKSMLTNDEKADVLAALQSLHAASYPMDNTVLTKLSVVFRQAQAPWIDVDFSDWSDLHRDVFTTLRTAILQRRVVTFQYYSRDGALTGRTVEPLQLRFKSRAWYLYAYCRRAQEMRTFRLTRIQALCMTEERFDREPAEPLQITTPFAPVEHPVIVMRIDEHLTYRVLDEFEPEQRVHNDDGSYTVRMHYPIDEWVIGYVLSFGPGAEVLEPKSLRKTVVERLRENLARYDIC